ncbi:MAG: hypothetical protein QW220_06260 [Candidatus Bathyarchaeia archaeon]
MDDPYLRLFYELEKRLPEKEDAELLKTLLEDMERGGKEAAIQRIRSLIRQLAGEEE